MLAGSKNPLSLDMGSVKVVLKHHLVDEKYYAQVNEDLSLLNANKNIRGKHILLAEKNDLNAEITITLLEDIGLIVEQIGRAHV